MTEIVTGPVQRGRGADPASGAGTQDRRVFIGGVGRMRSVGKAFAKACRSHGEDVQLSFGYDAVTAGAGFRSWNMLTAELGIVPERGWSDARCRSRALEMIPDLDPGALEAALDFIHSRFGERPCS